MLEDACLFGYERAVAIVETRMYILKVGDDERCRWFVMALDTDDEVQTLRLTATAGP
jgi:hypothetical protein